jgi:hypothetical protein
VGERSSRSGRWGSVSLLRPMRSALHERARDLGGGALGPGSGAGGDSAQ